MSERESQRVQPQAGADIVEPPEDYTTEQYSAADPDELPPRPRRRLFTPLTGSLLAVLLAACGFAAGVLVEKGQAGNGTPAASGPFGARGGGGFGARNLGGRAAAAGGGPFAGGPGGGGTMGQVSSVRGRTLYVQDTQGNTIKVTLPAGATVSRTTSNSVRAIHPGDSVVVQGASAKTAASGRARSARPRRTSPARQPSHSCSAAAKPPAGRAALEAPATDQHQERRMTNPHRLPVSLHVVGLLTCTAIVAAGLALAACGGSSKSSAAAGSQGSSNRARVAACLKQQGINRPRRPPGGGPGGGPGGPGGGPGLGLGLGGGPPGGGQSSATRTKFRAALRKCGVRFRGGRFSRNPAARQALVKFVACVRKNGYRLPAPNTSGTGPVFNRGQVNPNDPQFRTAASRCQGLLPQRPANPPPAGGQ